MRESGEVRFRFTGDEIQCQRLIPLARTLLGLLKRSSTVPFAYRKLQLQDGVTIQLTVNSGMSVIAIDVPEGVVVSASEANALQGPSTDAGPLVDMTAVATPLFGVIKGAPFLPTTPLYKPKVGETVLSLASPQQRNIVTSGSSSQVSLLGTGFRTADSFDVTATYGAPMRVVRVSSAIEYDGSLAWFNYSDFGWAQADVGQMYLEQDYKTHVPASQVTVGIFPFPTPHPFYGVTITLVVSGNNISVPISLNGSQVAANPSTVGGFSAVLSNIIFILNVDGSVDLSFRWYGTFQNNRFAFATMVKDWEPLVLATIGNPTLSGSLYTKTIVTRGASIGSVTFDSGGGPVTLSVYYPECDDIYTYQIVATLRDVVYTADADTPLFLIYRELDRDVPDSHISSGSSHGTDATEDVYKYHQSDLFEFRRDGTLVALPAGPTTTKTIPSGGGPIYDAAAQATEVRYGKNIVGADPDANNIGTRNFYRAGGSLVSYDPTTYEQHLAYPSYEIVIMPSQPSDPSGKRRYQVRVKGALVLEGFRAYTEDMTDPGQSVTYGTQGFYHTDTNIPVVYDSPVNGFAVGGGGEVLVYGLTARHALLNDQQFDSDQTYKQSTTAYFGSIFTVTHVNLASRTTYPGQTVALVPPEFPSRTMAQIFNGTANPSAVSLAIAFSNNGSTASTEFPSLAATISARVSAAQSILLAPGATALNSYKPLMALYAPYVAFIANGLSFTPASVLLAGAGDYLWIKR